MTDFLDEVARERISSLEKLFFAEIGRVDSARDDLKASVTSRFSHVNELRGALSDLGGTMATRRELEAFIAEYRIAHEVLASRVSNLHTAVAVGPSEVRELVKSEAERQGAQVGRDRLSTLLISMLGLMTALGVLAGHFLK